MACGSSVSTYGSPLVPSNTMSADIVTKWISRSCKLREIHFVTISADMVFDGTKGEPYVETDEPHAINVYGRSKAEGERRVFAAGGRNLVIRTSTFFSPYDSDNFA